MDKLQQLKQDLRNEPKTWLITGVAGFIGSNLLEALLRLDQVVVGLDNFATGHRYNLDDVRTSVSPEQWKRFSFVEGDVSDAETCAAVCGEVDIVLHQAALGSVSRSIENPLATNAANVTGIVNMLWAAKRAEVSRFVYAASSSTYGDHPDLPKVEHKIGRALSPYAVSKYVNELYADVFSRTYGIETVGLRYFNVFGKRQDPNGTYAAVIPRWFSAMFNGGEVRINGDGETSRDFCHIDNCVQANLLAGTTENPEAVNQVYNVAFGERTTLNELFGLIKERVSVLKPAAGKIQADHRDFRPGDVRHSLADISKARDLLGYRPNQSVKTGLDATVKWFAEKYRCPS